MKKPFLAFLVILSLSTSLINTAFAQDGPGINVAGMQACYGSAAIKNTGYSAINNHLNFHKKYTSVTKGLQAVTADDLYLAMINQGRDQLLDSYHLQEGLHHTIYYFGEEKMAHGLKHIIKSVYHDYSITGAVEINVNEPCTQTTYVVFIRNDNNIKRVTIGNDEILSVEDWTNSW